MPHSIANALVTAFDPAEPLALHDSRYVDCSGPRGSQTAQRNLDATISLASNRTCQLVAGHKGGGKTTELRRLADRLDSDGFFVVFCEADRYTNLNMVTYTDVLLAAAQSVFESTASLDIQIVSDEILMAVSGILQALNLDVARYSPRPSDLVTVLTTALQKDINLRQMCQSYLVKHARELLSAVSALLHAVQVALEAKKGDTHRGVVIIIDNLDRVTRTDVFSEDQFNHLFIEPSDIYTSLPCHLVLTVPTALVHSQAAAKIPFLYGSAPRVIPNLPTRCRDGDPNSAGLEKCREVVELRCNYAGTTMDQVFSPVQVEELCECSGGHFRLLMTLVRQSISLHPSLPVSPQALNESIADLSRFYGRCVRGETSRNVLRQVARTKQIPDDAVVLTLMENLLLFEYADEDGVWYDVNPLINPR